MKKIAVLGFGTVGSGVVEVMAQNAAFIARNTGEGIEVKYILDVRTFPDSPYANLFVRDFSVIEQDPEVSIVVETIGGVGIARELTKRSLLAGKSVVTSNKELVAKHGHEFIAIAKEKNINYLFEASVGGGIPILRPITQCLAANRIDEVSGILNGTTNYILTAMIQNGAGFEEALRQAQLNGYAEQDPSADIEGKDACRKISILSDLCFGKNVDPEDVSTQGIEGVTLTDVEYAGRLGCRIKLLGRAVRVGDGHITAYVAPHLLPEDMLLSHVDGVMNGIVVRGNALGESMFYGAGAGKMPTASAVVADVMDAARHAIRRRAIDWDEGSAGYVTDPDELVSAWYVRAKASDADLRAALGEILCLSGTGDQTEESACATGPMSGKELKSRLGKLSVAGVFRILK
jgi:homoserine dehydrogenase